MRNEIINHMPDYRLLLILLIFSSCLNTENKAQKVETNPKPTIEEQALIPQKSLIDPAGTTIATRIKTPDNFEREKTEEKTFEHYLQHFPCKNDGEQVLLYDGRLKYNQNVHVAILAIDVGKQDLQQCADAIMRLRAEYLWHQDRHEEIKFNFTNGFPVPYSKWKAGYRTKVQGNRASWIQNAKPSASYETFREYLTQVFVYAGTLSLAQELDEKSIDALGIGDVFIQGGSPGHAVIVVDKAVHSETQEVLFLLAQSYMPAQEIHVLKNFENEAFSPWYSTTEIDEVLKTPEWDFKAKDLKGF